MLEVRQLRIEDAEDVARLFVEGFGASRQMNGDEIREWFENEALKPENLLVVEREGRIVAYFDVWPEGESADIDVAAPGLWDEVFDLAEAHARAGRATRARCFLVEGHELSDRIAARGYRAVRGSWTMALDLGADAPAEAAAPEGIELRTYRHPEDEQRVYEAMQEAFLDHWGFRPTPIDDWREFNVKTRAFEPALWVVAWDDDEIAGASMNYAERPGDPGYGWVGTLGVRRAWRRRGVGEALLRRSFAVLHARGLRTVRLSVDAENPTGATRLYERAGMSVLRQSNTWERELDETEPTT